MSWRNSDKEDTTIYKVVVNHEEQYSIWPADRENALGWNDAGKSGTKQECLAYIEEVWTDMRPLSLRRRMAQETLRSESLADSGNGQDLRTPKPTLVERLSQGEHPVALGLRPEKSVHALKDSLERGYVFIKFTETAGGTELGVRLSREGTDLSRADLDAQTGVVHLEGELILNQIKVRCMADIDLDSLKGAGRLQPLTA
ncbi:MAG: hypothetical protein QOF02_1964 [Blastocatellia bacterium]|jgi:uncharacterized protein YbdZ (MbtH family)|nr:hypothetical protein [Blastocatellia bacterium]